MPSSKNNADKAGALEIAVFGGGCFWCTEAVFLMLRGVQSVAPGYAGGTTSNPTYDQVSSGRTGHAEVIKVEFDPSQISYKDLLLVFFVSHDPTSLNRQGNDVGTQYRSVVFYTTPGQKKVTEDFIAELAASDKDADGGAGKPIVTEVVPLDTFWPAEDYHRQYYEHHKDAMYCQLVIDPKIDKVRAKFENLLKTQSK